MSSLLETSPGSFTVSQHDWSLHHKGEADRARHNEKVKEAIKNNLPSVIGDESIITSDGKSIIKIPIHSLNLPKFRHGEQTEGVGQGSGEPGDVIGRKPGQGEANAPGQGPGAGDMPGVDYYEAEITIDELADLVFQDLGLPNLEDRGSKEIEIISDRRIDIRRKGPTFDLRRTIKKNLESNAKLGRPGFHDIKEEDLRYKIVETESIPVTNAVVIAMRDVSGSMGEFEKYITRGFYFWMVRWLRQQYQNVDIVFLTHHTEAKEVDEETFFRLGESGGTKVSSAYQLCLDIVQERYPIKDNNIYPFHFSDGDNWGEVDNKRCVELIDELLAYVVNMFEYEENRQGGRGSFSNTLWTAFEPVMRANPRFRGSILTKKEDIFPAMKHFFSEAEWGKR